MKKVLIALGLTAALAAPAMANNLHTRASANGYGAYASADRMTTSTVQLNSGVVLSGDGQQIGADPDTNVRLSLHRDAPSNTSQ